MIQGLNPRTFSHGCLTAACSTSLPVVMAILCRATRGLVSVKEWENASSMVTVGRTKSPKSGRKARLQSGLRATHHGSGSSRHVFGLPGRLMRPLRLSPLIHGVVLLYQDSLEAGESLRGVIPSPNHISHASLLEHVATGIHN